MKKNLRTASICVQGGYEPKNGEPIEVPIYQSTTFKYDNSEEMAMLFDLKKEGYFYTRLQNPTNDVVAKKIAELEGGVGAVLTSSGQAANFYAVFNICEAGDHIVTSNEIYGGTFNLFGVTLKKLGIECTFVNPNDSEEEIQKAFRPNTKVVFGETISNPGCAVLDIENAANEGNEKAQLALRMYEYRIKKYIGAYTAAMGGVDAIVFTAGVGENQTDLREDSCKNLEYLGIKINKEVNDKVRGEEAIISTDDSKVKVVVVPTDEEIVIARDTMELVAKK